MIHYDLINGHEMMVHTSGKREIKRVYELSSEKSKKIKRHGRVGSSTSYSGSLIC
jgi:hypothetical protein